MTFGEKIVHKSYHRSLLKNAYNFLEKAHVLERSVWLRIKYYTCMSYRL